MLAIIIFSLCRPSRIVVREVAISLPGNYKKFRASENDDMIMVEQSVDWLHNRLFILILKMKPDGQKEYRVVSCDTGKWISEVKHSVLPETMFIILIPVIVINLGIFMLGIIIKQTVVLQYPFRPS